MARVVAPAVPTQIRIGAAVYRVDVIDDPDKLGETDDSHTLITITSDQSECSTRDTVIHEALHAIMWCSGARRVLDLSHKHEERIVRLLSPAVLALLRDNPD